MWFTSLDLPGRCGICMNQHSTSGIRRRRIRRSIRTLHILTHGAMRGCGLTAFMVCINDKIRDIRERNVTTRSERTEICSLGFREIREWVTLCRMILRSLGCTYYNEARLCVQTIDIILCLMTDIIGRAHVTI
jgi:hypothetical protein